MASHQPASQSAKDLGRRTGRNSGFFQQNPDTKFVWLLAAHKKFYQKIPDKNLKDFFHYLGEHVNPNKKSRSNEALSIPRLY